MSSLNRFADPVYCIVRFIIGLMFACHGGQKLLGFPPAAHPGVLDTMGTVGGSIELVGGFLIAFGLLTRFAALIASGEMAVAYFMVHSKMHFFPIINKGELAVVYCWFFLFVLFYGPGRWSLDAIFCRKSAGPTSSSA